MKIAICSQSGQKVDQCFGHSTKFYIYKLIGSCLNFEAMRMVEPYFNVPEVFTQYDPDRFSHVYEAIEDCTKVYCVSIDSMVEEKLEEREVEVKLSNKSLKEIFHELTHKKRR